MWGLMLREKAEAVRSTLTAAIGTLLDIGALQNSIRVQAAIANYRIKNAHGVE